MSESEPNTPTTQRFANKVALVTGSGRGVGRAIALRLAKEGADIVVNFFRNREPAEATAKDIEALGRRAYVVKANISEEKDIERLFAEVKDNFAGLDILVNNAANGFNRPVMEQRVKGWDWTMNINARAALFTSQQAVPMMQQRGGGHIINISSMGAQRVMPDYVLVGASKAALEALTRYLAVELGPLNISVNAVSAGFIVGTEALQHFPTIREWLDKLGILAQQLPAGRNVDPDDVAGAVAFLCSPDAFMIRGQVLMIDGGYTLI